MPTLAIIFSPFAFLRTITLCWCVGAQYRSFCECGGDHLNTNHFSSVHISLSNHSFRIVNQNSLADFLAILLAGERTWDLWGLKAFHFQSFCRTFHPVPILGFNLLKYSQMWLLYSFWWKVFSPAPQSPWRETLSCCFSGVSGSVIIQSPSHWRTLFNVAVSGDSWVKNRFWRLFGFAPKCLVMHVNFSFVMRNFYLILNLINGSSLLSYLQIQNIYNSVRYMRVLNCKRMIKAYFYGGGVSMLR